MQVRKAVERRRFAIQAVFSLLTNSYVVGFLTGTIYKGPLKQICVPGMNCYSCPGALGACPIGSLQAIFNQSDFSKGVWSDSNGYLVTKPLYYFAFYVVGFLMLVGALCGRLVCGFLCPFGLIQDLLHKIPLPKKLKIRTFPGDKQLRYLKYFFLVVFVIVLPLLYESNPFFCKYICPSGMLLGGIPLMTYGSLAGNTAAGTGTGITSWAEAGGLTSLKLGILAATILLSIMIYRPFCKYICPLGAIYSFFNRISLYRYSVDESKCTHCGVCKTFAAWVWTCQQRPTAPNAFAAATAKRPAPTMQSVQGSAKRLLPPKP